MLIVLFFIRVENIFSKKYLFFKSMILYFVKFSHVHITQLEVKSLHIFFLQNILPAPGVNNARAF